jgi:hypothetical protein
LARRYRHHRDVEAIVEKLNGKAVDWMEKVTDEQYLA